MRTAGAFLRGIPASAKEERMNVKTIAVIGASTMGRGIAYAAAFGRYNTILEGVSRQMLEQRITWIQQSFQEGVAPRQGEGGCREKALSLISPPPQFQDAT